MVLTLERIIPWLRIIASIILVVAGVGICRRAFKTPLRSIPGPWFARFSRLWLLRAYAGRSFHKTNLDLHRKYGPIVRIGPNEYSIDDPEAAKILYRVADQLEKSPRYLAWGVPTNEQNIFSAVDVARHTERRKQTASLYQWNTLSQFEHQLDQLTLEFLNRMSNFASSGTTIELNHWLHYYALDAIGAVALGKPFGLLSNGGDVAGLLAAVQRYSRYGAIVGVYAELHPTIFRLLSAITPTGAHGLGYLVQVMNRAIDEEAAVGEKPTDSQHHLVSMLFDKHRRDPENFTHDDIRFHVVPSIGGGSDTTAITLGAVIYNLSRAPSIMHKLRRELLSRKREGRLSHPATFKEGQDCPYLQAVLKETMRVYPGNGLPMPRIIPEGGLTLAGQYLPAGTIVGINAWVSNFNRSVFGADADIFRPERWLDASQEQLKRMNEYFLTFGKGPRSCLGKNISFLELSKLIPELVLAFDFEMEGGNHREWRLLNDWFVRQSGWEVKVTKARSRDA